LPELHSRDLVCWCAPLPCHGDVLLELSRVPAAGAMTDLTGGADVIRIEAPHFVADVSMTGAA
jgi:hypothetical protein